MHRSPELSCECFNSESNQVNQTSQASALQTRYWRKRSELRGYHLHVFLLNVHLTVESGLWKLIFDLQLRVVCGRGSNFYDPNQPNPTNKNNSKPFVIRKITIGTWLMSHNISEICCTYTMTISVDEFSYCKIFNVEASAVSDLRPNPTH